MRIIDKVKKILSEFESTRNSDDDLVAKYWWTYYNGALFWDDKHGWSLPLNNLPKVLKYDSITRARRTVQENGEYIPTLESVIRKRRLNEKKMRLTKNINSIYENNS